MFVKQLVLGSYRRLMIFANVESKFQHFYEDLSSWLNLLIKTHQFYLLFMFLFRKTCSTIYIYEGPFWVLLPLFSFQKIQSFCFLFITSTLILIFNLPSLKSAFECANVKNSYCDIYFCTMPFYLLFLL